MRSAIISRIAHAAGLARSTTVSRLVKELSETRQSLETVLQRMGDLHGDEPPRISDTFPADTPDAISLGIAFRERGSDKATRHDYNLAYAALLGPRRGESLQLFEVGIGSINPATPSHMAHQGASGHPGASLRAWRDWAPGWSITGVDIDAEVLFSEPGIRTMLADHRDFNSLSAAMGTEGYDVIVDDGLHRLDANLNALVCGLAVVKPGGCIMIEDIERSVFPFWNALARATHHKFDAKLYLGRFDEGLLVVRP